jgi:uncharacterized protein
MRLSPETSTAGPVIRAYAPGRITVNEEVVTTSVVLTRERILHDWPPAGFEDLSAPLIDALADLEPEVVLLGTGATLRFPDARVLAGLYHRGIGFEVMGTAAACRTFNLLSGEGRRVVAALLMI